jgi:hypothetical protein
MKKFLKKNKRKKIKFNKTNINNKIKNTNNKKKQNINKKKKCSDTVSHQWKLY